jgi:hypothetical protein
MIPEPRYDVISGGSYLAVAVPKDEAFRIARDGTKGKTVMIQGKVLPAIATVYGAWPYCDAVAMFEDGKRIPLPRGA